MNLADAQAMADKGQLYPSVILHGGRVDAATAREKRVLDERMDAAVDLARRLLCARPGADPEGSCVHCRRIGRHGDEAGFHPDFMVLEPDLPTATSTGATREFLLAAQVAPFEARGQVFVIANAESLTPEAGNALLKNLEEPHLTAPRHFLLLAPSQFDLLPTLRSRSLAVYLGAGARPDAAALADVIAGFSAALDDYAASRSPIDLLAAASALAGESDWQSPRATAPWVLAAAAVRGALDSAGAIDRRRLLDLADELLRAQRWRLRGVPAQRLLEGLVVKHLGPR